MASSEKWGDFLVLPIFPFMEVNNTPQKIHHFNYFKAYKSVALRTYTIWCHHHHSLIPEHLHCPPKEPPTHQPSPLPTSHHSYPPAITPHPFPIPPILSNHSATFCPWICLFWTFYRWKEPYTMWSFVSAFFQLSMLAKFIHVET